MFFVYCRLRFAAQLMGMFVSRFLMSVMPVFNLKMMLLLGCIYLPDRNWSCHPGTAKLLLSGFWYLILSSPQLPSVYVHTTSELCSIHCQLLGLVLCLLVQQKETQAWGPLKLLIHLQVLPRLVLQEHGVYVRLAISYVLKWMEVKTMLYLEGEFSHAT